MALTDIPGHRRAVARLEAALRSGRSSHAYLVVGPAGVGRLELARELAAVLLCDRGGESKCGACRSCSACASGSHPDYEELGVPEGKQELPIELIRQLQDRAALKPLLSGRRVFVVKDAERMNIAAANCFLKTLEEPPGAACIILIATGLWDLPETIVSRCQVVKLGALPAEAVQESLQEEGLAQADAWWLARRAWGSPGLAAAFGHMNLHVVNAELAQSVLEMTPQDAASLTDRLCGLASGGGGGAAQSRLLLQEILECLAVLYRDAAVALVAQGEVELFNVALDERLRAFAARCDLDLLIDCADRALEAVDSIGANANVSLTLDNLFAGLGGTLTARPG